MAGIYKTVERFGGREWLLQDRVKYVSAHPAKLRATAEKQIGFTLLSVTDKTAARFDNLARRWEDDTRFLSSVTQIVLHPAYQQIIGMGPAALSLILGRLVAEPLHWFWALNAITGENPVNARDAGNVARMRDAWVNWGKVHGYIE